MKSHKFFLPNISVQFMPMITSSLTMVYETRWRFGWESGPLPPIIALTGCLALMIRLERDKRSVLKSTVRSHIIHAQKEHHSPIAKLMHLLKNSDQWEPIHGTVIKLTLRRASAGSMIPTSIHRTSICLLLTALCSSSTITSMHLSCGQLITNSEK